MVEEGDELMEKNTANVENGGADLAVAKVKVVAVGDNGNCDNIVAVSMEENGGGGGVDGDGANLAAEVKAVAYVNGNELTTESREEGELSSYSDDEDSHEEVPTSQFADCNAEMESVQVASMNKITKVIEPEICKPANKTSSMVGVSSSPYPQLDNHQGSEKSRGQFVPFLIGFSDDDSGSDSDDSRHNNLESKDNTQGPDKSSRPPLPSLQKSKALQHNRVKEARLAPKQMSVGHPVVSSKAKINGATSSKAGRESSCRNLSNPKKGSVQDQQKRKNVQLDTTKMQDLRQLIEIRENQIKLKTTQQAKFPVTGSYRDQSAKNPCNPVSRVRKAAEVHDLRSILNNPDKKRLKTGEPQPSNLCLDCSKNFPTMGEMLPLEKSMSRGKQNLECCCYCGKNNALGTSHASQLGERKQNVRQALISSANPLTVGEDGPQVVASSILDNVNAETLGPIVSPAQTGQTRNRPGEDYHLKQDKLSIKESSNMDIPSMLEFENLFDKELEEAQELRRKCEIDERNAVTAYRKAQRALVEANIRCSHLYCKRELYSAQLRSLMMENPNQFFSLRPHDQTEAGLSVSNKISDVNVHLRPTSSHHVQGISDINGRREYDSNIPPRNSAYQGQCHLNVDGQNFVSGPCVEPDDGSSSEAHKQDDGLHNVCSSDGDTTQSADEDDEIFQLEPKSTPDNLESVQTSECNAGRDKDRNHGLQGQPSFDTPEDSLLLEASLRSQLYEKLRTKKLLKGGTGQIIESTNERFDNDDGGEMMTKIAEEAPLREAEINENSYFESEPKRFSELLGQISSHSDVILPEHASLPVGDLTKSNFSLKGPQSTISVTFLCPTIKSAFVHLKVKEPVGVLPTQPSNLDMLNPDIKKGVHQNCIENQTIRLAADTELTTLSFYDGQSGCYSCNLAIDPLLPLCMFELRGKCNNDECPWQHVKDYSCNNMQHDAIDDTDCQVHKASQREKVSSTAIASKSLDHFCLVPPTYMVGSDVLRPNSQAFTSLLSQDYGQCWQKCFSNFLVLSSLFSKASASNEPFLHGTEARIEVHGDWNRQSSYFHSRNGKVGQVDHSYADVDESLEMALLNFSKEANKQKGGRMKALGVLSPAIEANPRSAVLWIVYLQIYYFQKSIGKDDLFVYAVEINKESYELWLLFINSREQLDDRLAAYDAALSALSHHAFAGDGDALNASQYVLDIFLQMMDFMCSSGNVGSAIEKISELILSTKDIHEPCQLTIPKVMSCLTICDKFFFWISCVYLVLYKKLPDPVVHSLECWKEFSILEWPVIHLTFDEKQLAGSLMEMAVEFLASYMDHESLGNERTLRAAHHFALNHVKCISIVESLECGRLLLEKYIKLYPSCVELVLMQARVQHHIGGLSFDGFEEALGNWPDEMPGVQCLWNQYAESALQSGKFAFVQELMDGWFQSVVKKGQDLHRDNANLLQLASASDLCAWFSCYSQTDNIFGILNLSLHKILQDDHTDALCALNQALKSSSADNYFHCLRELTMFLLTNSIHHNGKVDVKHVLNTLNVHLADGRAWIAAEPLSRLYIQKIGKPRARHLVNKMLKPVSTNFSQMNMVVEIWNVLLSVPQIYDNLIDLVDFVEGVMEIMPSNYLLAMSVCKTLIKSTTLNDSTSIYFWGSSLLVNALSNAVPIAPEYIWVGSAEILLNLTDCQKIGESFHRKALSVYPFSIKLWKSYLRLSETAGNGDSIKAAAKNKGIVLD